MGFVKNEQKEITVPGGTVTIRKLSRRSLDKAEQARQIEVGQNLSAMTEGAIRGMFGSPEMRQLEAKRAAEKEGKKKPSYDEARKNRYKEYDVGHVLLAGILRWSFPEPPSQDPANDLDDETATILHEAILDFSLKPLDPSEYEVERGKDFVGSTIS